MKNKIIITAAITGAVHIPAMSPYLPITPKQIIDEAVAANEAGAAVVHLHARDPITGKPDSNPALMQQIVSGIKSRCDVIVGVTTGGAIGAMSTEERLAVLPVVKPQLASCNAGSVNFCFSAIADKIKEPQFDWEIPFVKNTYQVVFSNTFQEMEDYIRIMNENGTKPEFEIYDVGMISNVAYFLEKGMLKPPVYLQFVMGVMGGIPATADNLLYLYNTARAVLGDQFVWSCAAAGRRQFDLTTMALTLGGNVRVGLEDNLYIRRGELAKSNAEPVAKIRRVAELLDREIAAPNEARTILGLD